MYRSNTEIRDIAGLIRCWSIAVLEHWDTGTLEYWCTGILVHWILVHWDTGAHCCCNRKFECGNLVEFDLTADCVHECNCTRSPVLLSLTSSSLAKGIENGILTKNINFICCILGCILYLRLHEY